MIRYLPLILLSTIIVFVSSVDNYWTSKNRDIMLEVEQNPIGTALIMADGGDVSLFIATKMFTTYIVIGVLFSMAFRATFYQSSQNGDELVAINRNAEIVASVLAFLQIILLIYLYFG